MTSNFKFSKRSLDTLSTVKEDLRKVVTRALELTSVDFVVVQGNRTRDDQERLYGQGRTAAQMRAAGLSAAYAKPGMKKVTWTMHSNHIGGEAVDLAAYVNGAINWDTNKGYYQDIAKAMKQAAEELGININWGGDWNKTKDYPHFELS